MLSWPPRAFARSTSLPDRLAGGLAADDRRGSRVLDQIAQAVGAEDERVAGHVVQRLRPQLGLDLRRHPERPRDAVRVRMVRRLLRA